MPKITQTSECLRASCDTSFLGKSNKAGVPELIGRLSSTNDNDGIQLFEKATANGVFSLEYTTKKWASDLLETASLPYALNFTASNSNKIFGNSDTVMPASINLPIIIYLGR